MPEPVGGYPILLHLQDRQVAVIGGGRVGARKVKHLLGAGARVLLVSLEANAGAPGARRRGSDRLDRRAL